jgi:hypothetical protein
LLPPRGNLLSGCLARHLLRLRLPLVDPRREI